MIFWLWITGRKKKSFPLEFPNGRQEKFKTGRIWSLASIKNRLRCIHWPGAAPGRMPRPYMGALTQLQAGFSHVAVNPCLRLREGSTRVHLLVVARPICTRHQEAHHILQGAVEICCAGTGENRKDSPAVLLPLTVFFLACLLPEGWGNSEQECSI